MAQRTILFLGGSMTGLRLPVDDVPNDGSLVVAVPDPTVARFLRGHDDGDTTPSLSVKRETYRQVRFGLVNAEMMILDELSPDRALGQYLRGEIVR